MTPSKQCKDAGLKGLAQLACITGESVQTLNNWHKSERYRRRFDLLLKGVVFERMIDAHDAIGKR